MCVCGAYGWTKAALLVWQYDWSADIAKCAQPEHDDLLTRIGHMPRRRDSDVGTYVEVHLNSSNDMAKEAAKAWRTSYGVGRKSQVSKEHQIL